MNGSKHKYEAKPSNKGNTNMPLVYLSDFTVSKHVVLLLCQKGTQLYPVKVFIPAASVNTPFG